MLKTQEMDSHFKELHDKMYAFWIEYKMTPGVAESLALEFWGKTVAQLLNMPDARISYEILHIKASSEIKLQALNAVVQAREDRDGAGRHFRRIGTTTTELNRYLV